MDEQSSLLSTSPNSVFSQFSSHDTAANGSIIPTLSALSVLSPMRSSVTLATMNNLTHAQENQNFLRDELNTQKSLAISRWQSDSENLNLRFNSPNQQSLGNTDYLINEFLTSQSIPSSFITDSLVSPMSRLSTSSSVMSLNSIGNQKPISQRSSRSMTNHSIEQFIVPTDSMNLFSSASSFLPLPTPSTHRPILSSIDNMPLTTTDNDLQRVPPSFMFMQPSSTYTNGSMRNAQPQLINNITRSNSMPTWRGNLPIRLEPTTMDQYQTATHFSQKVFLGGIPAELSEAELLLILRKFGKCNIKWPKNDGIKNNVPTFCHVVYREARSVTELLRHCSRQHRSTIDYFLHIHLSPSSTSSDFSMCSTRYKPIQVVPWNMKDNVYTIQHKHVPINETTYKDWSRTIFVSPLHGKMTAYSLGSIMANVFGAVLMAQINTDKYGYPTGTGTVLFCDSHSYMRAVAAGAIDIKCDCFHKLLDIDPFLRENEPCAYCSSVAEMFCRNFHCLRSYCKQCWINKHGPKPLADHQPATRRQQTLLQI